MVELCDVERIWLAVIAALLLALAGLVSPIIGGYIKSKSSKDHPPVKKPAWYWWALFIFLTLAGIGVGGVAGKASVKICDRVALTRIVCESVTGDRGASEVVTLQNQDDHDINMDRWKLCDFQGKHCYQFTHFKLAEAASVELYTTMGNDTTDILYWNSGAAIWNDMDDTARLMDHKGRTVDELACPPLPPTPTSTPSPIPASTPTQTLTPTPTQILSPTPALPLIAGAGCTDYHELYRWGDFERAIVTNVIDASIIEVSMDGRYDQVRYIGVETPDLFEVYGLEAVTWHRDLIMGKTVLLFPDPYVGDGEVENYYDDEGRLLRYVLVDDHFVNYDLLRLGYARISLDYPGTQCADTFLDAQTYAMDHSLGMWSLVIPAPTSTSTPTLSSTAYAPCDCDGYDLNCSDFYSHASAQACYNYCLDEGYGDVFGLDHEGDGYACESLP